MELTWDLMVFKLDLGLNYRWAMNENLWNAIFVHWKVVIPSGNQTWRAGNLTIFSVIFPAN